MGTLVDKHLSRFYPNYINTRAVLLRQARDLLICEFRGDLVKFTSEFLLPAEQLLQPFAETVQVSLWGQLLLIIYISQINL